MWEVLIMSHPLPASSQVRLVVLFLFWLEPTASVWFYIWS